MHTSGGGLFFNNNYVTVVVCLGFSDVIVPTDADATQLSAIITSSLQPAVPGVLSQDSCTVYVKDLPTNPAYYTLEVLYSHKFSLSDRQQTASYLLGDVRTYRRRNDEDLVVKRGIFYRSGQIYFSDRAVNVSFVLLLTGKYH